MSPADLDDLLANAPPADRERLRRAHDLLGTVDPPPEVPPDLTVPPKPPTTSLLPTPRRYRSTVFVAAVIVGLALLGVGYLLGGGGDRRQAVRTVELSGAGAERGELRVLRADDAGNWPLELTVHDLEPLPADGVYELWRTRGSEPVERVGSFVTSGDEVTVTLSVPSAVADADGWVVVVGGTTEPVLRGAAS